MNIKITASKQRKKADVLVVPFWQGKKGGEPAFSVRALSTFADLPVRMGDFQGKQGEALFLYSSKLPEKRLLLIGLGKEKECTPEMVRRSYATCARVCRQKKCARVNVLLIDKLETSALLEGLLLANYDFTQFKHSTKEEEKEGFLAEINLVGNGDQQEIKKSIALISCVHLTRDLVNGNADDVNAETLAKAAREIGRAFPKIKTRVLGRKELEKEKMGLLLAVNRGAMLDPALVLMEYRGDPSSKDVTAIVGKGVSFDTGGLNLKGTGNIETMKGDMAGAGTVLGIMRAAASLGLKKNILGVLACVENAIGPKSYKPGDVYRSHSGKTVEISNTDAEGRLILADALSYVQKTHKVSRIIDLATLTGAIVIALGEEVTGLFTNNDTLAQQLEEAGERTFERVWRFPLYPEYRDALKSPIADMKNSGGRKGGSITAALFLQEFIKDDIPWAHLDIAGTAFLSEFKRSYHTTHATGVGVRLLIDFLQAL